MKARHKRFAFLLVGLAVLGVAVWLVFQALGNNLSYFFSSTEVVEGKAPANHVFRLGGLVEKGSLQRKDAGKAVVATFVVTDNHESVRVRYQGILPDLFSEGRGVIAQGRLGPDGVFVADTVLAKHDENYMPPEVAAALNKAHEQGVAEMAAQGGKP
jgi:cytochrome c-type biogenesis protein CcmE